MASPGAADGPVCRLHEWYAVMTRPLILVSIVLSVYSGQTAPPIPIPTAPRPLENIAKPSSVAEIEFNDFEFLEPGFGHAGIRLRPLEGEPVAGKRY